MPGKFRLALVAAVIFLLSVAVAPTFAAPSQVISTSYNKSLLAFQNLKQIGGQHNTFVSYHRGRCALESGKSWTGKARRIVAGVKGYLKALWKLSAQQRKKRVFKDLVHADRLLKGWAQGQIVDRLGTCKKMPTGSYNVQQGLSTVANDLGIQGGY